ncbi:hypothetical protein MY3957_003080 [Beauveria namnaoensis]
MRAMANLDRQQASGRRRQGKKPACFGKRNSVGPAPRGQGGWRERIISRKKKKAPREG